MEENKIFDIIENLETNDGTKVEILQFNELKGSSDISTAENLYFANQSGVRLKMVHIKLNNSHVRIEPGALYFMKGNLEIRASTGGGFMKGLARMVASGESFFVNEIHGTGDIYLEPTFGHFFLHEINSEEGGIIVDKSLFYGGTAGLDISAMMQKNVSSALFGGEGFFQTLIKGEGVAILYSPVPNEEIIKYELTGDKLSVDGNFALMRSERINFRAEKSSKSWIATSVSGEGLLQTFEGNGFVWIAPTQGVYEKLKKMDGIRGLTGQSGSMGTKTKSG